MPSHYVRTTAVEARVAREWSSDGAMRARVRWRVDKSLALMNGGYRELLV